jgi:hypothetical protein
VIEKLASGPDASFGFTSPQLGEFSLTTRNGVASQVFTDLADGVYQVTEKPSSDWVLVAESCDNGDSPGSIQLKAGENVTCTFRNTFTQVIPTLSSPALVLLAALMTLMVGWVRRTSGRRLHR